MKIVSVFLITAAIMLTACSAIPASQESSTQNIPIEPTRTPRPTPVPTIDPLCEDAHTIVYVVERQELWLRFLHLQEQALAHIEKNNMKELRKDALIATDLSNDYRKTLSPPSFLRDYNDYMEAAVAMYGQALYARIDGKTDIEETYTWGMESLLKKASDEHVKAWMYCQWTPEGIPFEPSRESLPTKPTK